LQSVKLDYWCDIPFFDFMKTNVILSSLFPIYYVVCYDKGFFIHVTSYAVRLNLVKYIAALIIIFPM